VSEGDLVWKNLFRRKLRTLLLVASIFVAFLLFGVLASFNEGYSNAPNAEGDRRLIVLNKVHSNEPIPYSYLERIRRLPGVAAATNWNWLGGYYREKRNRVQTFSVDVDAFTRMNRREMAMPDAQWRAFRTQRDALIVSRAVAEKHGFQVGQRVPLHSNIFTNKTTGGKVWAFTIVGIFDRVGNPNSAFFNFEYFRESDLWGANGTSRIVVDTADRSLNEVVARRIDAMFANSEAQTATQAMSAYTAARMAQYGDIGFVITLVVGAAFVAILMVVGNSMVMAVRERTREIGVMKTLGFSGVRIVRQVLGESLLLSLLGAGLGLALAALMLAGVGAVSHDVPGISTMPAGFRRTFDGLHMSALVAGAGVALAVAFGLVTGAIPALSAYRVSAAQALARR
jgi:putative ABC transport system permease protein